MLATSDFPQFYHRSITGTYHIFILVAWFHDHIFKSYKTAISHSCEHPWLPNNIFSSITLRDIVLCIKSQTRLFIYFSSIIIFFETTPWGFALLIWKFTCFITWPYFPKHRSFYIRRCAFKGTLSGLRHVTTWEANSCNTHIAQYLNK